MRTFVHILLRFFGVLNATVHHSTQGDRIGNLLAAIRALGELNVRVTQQLSRMHDVESEVVRRRASNVKFATYDYANPVISALDIESRPAAQ